MLRWGIGITLAGFLAGGGIALAVTGGSNPAAAVSGLSGVSGSSQVQGTTLNSVLNTATGTSPSVSLPRLRWALARLRALGGVDGEFTFHNSTGFHTAVRGLHGGQAERRQVHLRRAGRGSGRIRRRSGRQRGQGCPADRHRLGQIWV